MADFLILATLSNLVVSAIIAVIAWVVQRRIRSAALANLLWAIVLVKMITPPLFSLPVIEVPSVSQAQQQPSATSEVPSVMPLDEDPETGELLLASETKSTAALTATSEASSRYRPVAQPLVLFTWLTGSVALFFVSAFRVWRFHCLLRTTARVHSDLTAKISAPIAIRLGLCRRPNILLTSAKVGPFVWWMGARSVIVLSEHAVEELSQDDLRFVVTHEMVHIKRCDHWFRWIEWFAVIAFWWNPVMWWVRGQLRLTEEMACDVIVLETATTPEVHNYANSLLNVAELFASPAIRPPAMASAINGGGHLERRLKMMMTGNAWNLPSKLRMAIVASAVCVVPLGIVAAQDFEAVERRLGGAVEAGELTIDQAAVMMEALSRAEASSRQNRELEGNKRRYMEIERQIKDALEAGDISEEDAERILIGMRCEMIGGGGEGAVRAAEMKARKRRFAEMERKIGTAVREGKLSEAGAEEKLIDIRRELFGEAKERGSRDIEGLKRKYEAVAKKTKAAVEAGEITKEEAQKKLIGLRREMFAAGNEREGQAAEMKARKRRYAEMEREIGTAVREGKLSEEEAEKKLIGIRTELFGQDGGDRDMEARKRRYETIAQKIESAVDKGEISPDEAEKKLIETRREIFNREDRQQEDQREAGEERSSNDARDDEFNRKVAIAARKIEAFEAQLNKQVADGTLTKEEFKTKLLEYSNKVFPSR